ncbi:hypothetical protein [Ferribacterium limneticum]|uniref:hypothetical protein n=1 Tax=Ferribacterium limneticum TaxID=76259 RepID=UPI001CFB845D|nr:hypothetical protein [Ferribacterium limneticum]UCV18524.1 hypothetical protein KI610_17280 [Ferribacterium limneticum]
MAVTMGQLGLRHARCRLAGDNQKLGRRQQKLLAQIESLKEQVAALDALLQGNTEKMLAIDSALQVVFSDQQPLIARQTFPKRHALAWGAITRGVLTVMRDSNGAILSTHEVTLCLADQTGFELQTGDDFQGLRKAVRHRLAALANKGTIERLHEHESNQAGLWRLKAPSE